MLRRLSLLAGALALLPCTAASAQDVGDPEAGAAVAEEICAECHDVLAGEGVFERPHPLPFEPGEVLAFEDIANTPGVTATVLFAWMTSNHPTMPDFILEPEEIRNVVAYILSLKNQRDTGLERQKTQAISSVMTKKNEKNAPSMN